VTGPATLAVSSEPGDVVVATLEGEVDMANAAELEEAIVAAAGNHVATVVVDLSGLEYLDSAGVRMLLTIASRCRRSQQEVRVVAPAGTRARSVLALAGAEHLLALDETRADALAGGRRA
jgi:anti-anti-sigma factor